ncbi:MAG: hypothetical protein GY810_22215 [Aureispira sp.]|nr:hypothetical protein [Aureispira sp.]
MQFAQKLYKGIFPQRLKLDQKEQELLQKMYPTVDWEYVRYYRNMPWYMLKSFAIATALPHSYSGKYINIYFKSYKPNTFISTCTLVHEAFHVLQYEDMASMNKKGWGLGFFRRFIRYYLGWYFAKWVQTFLKKGVNRKEVGYQAYRYHEMEIPAYDHESIFGENFHHYRNADDSSYLFQQAPKLVIKNSNSPKRPPIWAWLLGSIIALVLTIVKPIADCLILIIALLFGGWREDKTLIR